MIAKLLMNMTRIQRGVSSRLLNFYFKLLGCKINGYAWLQSIRIPRQWSDITIENGAALDERVTLIASHEPVRNKIHIGENVYINRNTIIDAAYKVEVGAESMIGPNCYITDHDHEYKPGDAPGQGGLTGAPTILGSRVWLGANVTILKGVEIGDNSIIGAGSVVTRSVPPNSLALGVPAAVRKSLPAPLDAK